MTRARSPRATLEALLSASLGAVDAGAAVRAQVASGGGGELAIAGRPVPKAAGIVVFAVGKAAAAMSRAVEEVAGSRIRAGLCVTKDGHGLPLERLGLREAAHPVPDVRCEAAAREALRLVADAAEDDVLLVLLSGGASSLLSCPLEGLAAADLAATTELLLATGADIEELNVVRKHLSAAAGGRLAKAAKSRRIEVLAVSDVMGDRLDLIGSGPCAADPSTFAQARDILSQRGVEDGLPRAVCDHLARGERGELPETPKPGDPTFERVRSTIVACNADARAAAELHARALGLEPELLGETLRGEAREAGRHLARLGRAASRPGVCLIAGGETTVTVRGRGRGGRNQELALAAALDLAGDANVTLLAAGTDGSDGPTDAAGAVVDGETVARGLRLGLDARAALEDNDSYTFFSGEGGLVVTGPTSTNVMDLALVLVNP